MLIGDATAEDWPAIGPDGTVPGTAETHQHPVEGYVGLHVMYRRL